MPVIARFYGIVVKMYFNEHGVPHFHVSSNEDDHFSQNRSGDAFTEPNAVGPICRR
jgi:hypothetical protein